MKQFLPAATTAAGQFAAFKKLMADGGAGNGAVPGFPVLPAPPAAVMPGIVKRLRALVKRIKSAEGYTVAIGRDLRIIAPVAATPTVAPKPKFKAVAQPNSMVRLAWTKGKFSGVVVESRRHGGNWEEIGRDNFSPYDDTRPPLTAGQPEVREYRLRYLQKDQPVGDYSDTITVTTTP